MTRHCPQCDFENSGEGKYCSRCGSALPEDDQGAETTIRYSPEVEEHEADVASAGDAVKQGVHLFVRSGGDLAGEIFAPSGDKTTIGRHQESDIFLDDITVSRHHAILWLKDDGYYIQDQGSLNGTYVNRVRVETQKLVDGDQLQIGKFKLTFLER